MRLFLDISSRRDRFLGMTAAIPQAPVPTARFHFYLLPIAGFGIFLFIILSMKSAGNVGALAYWRRNASRRSKSLNVIMF